MAEGVLLTADAARRIAAATRKVEGTGADVPPGEWYPYVPDDPGGVKLCKTTAAWAKGTAADLDEYTGTPGSETADTPPVKVKAWNKFASVQAGKWVTVTQINGHWYLTAAEC
jgi:hypothetical protein